MPVFEEAKPGEGKKKLIVIGMDGAGVRPFRSGSALDGESLRTAIAESPMIIRRPFILRF